MNAPASGAPRLASCELSVLQLEFRSPSLHSSRVSRNESVCRRTGMNQRPLIGVIRMQHSLCFVSQLLADITQAGLRLSAALLLYSARLNPCACSLVKLAVHCIMSPCVRVLIQYPPFPLHIHACPANPTCCSFTSRICKTCPKCLKSLLPCDFVAEEMLCIRVGIDKGYNHTPVILNISTSDRASYTAVPLTGSLCYSIHFESCLSRSQVTCKASCPILPQFCPSLSRYPHPCHLAADEGNVQGHIHWLMIPCHWASNSLRRTMSSLSRLLLLETLPHQQKQQLMNKSRLRAQTVSVSIGATFRTWCLYKGASSLRARNI